MNEEARGAGPLEQPVRLRPLAPGTWDAECPIGCGGTLIAYGGDDMAPCRRCGTEYKIDGGHVVGLAA